MSEAPPTPDAPVEPDWLAQIERYSERYGRDATIGEIIADVAEERAQWLAQHRPTPEDCALPGDAAVERMADVDARPVDWLWAQRIPRGCLTVLAGHAGEGKSFATLDWAARISTGTPWPDGAECVRGDVVLLCGEDDPHAVLRPRLDAMRADVERIHRVRGVWQRDDHHRPYLAPFTLQYISSLEAQLSRLPNAQLLVVDPIGTYLGGGVDAHRDNEVRSVLAPLAALAEKHNIAALVVAHTRKASADRADDTVLGSRAFSALARSVLHLRRDEDDRARRLLLAGKSNYGASAPGLAMRIAGDPPTVQWEDDPIDLDADDALAAEHERRAGGPRGPEPTARSGAEEWLLALLADGPQPVRWLRREAEAAGWAWASAVRRAAESIGVRRTKTGLDGGWEWSLPASDADGDGGGQGEQVSPQGKKTCSSSGKTCSSSAGASARGGQSGEKPAHLRDEPDNGTLDFGPSAEGEQVEQVFWKPAHLRREGLDADLVRWADDGGVVPPDPEPTDPEPDPGPARTRNMDRLAFAVAVHAPDRAVAVPAEWRAGVLPGVADNGQPWGAL